MKSTRIFSRAFVLPSMNAGLSITALAPGALCENLNDGLVAHSVEVVDGRGSRVAAFDGVGSSISLPGDEALEMTGDYGVSFWVRVNQGCEKNAPILAQPDFVIAMFKGTLRVKVANTAYEKTGRRDIMGPSVNDWKWHHAGFTRSGASERFRFKGELSDLGIYSKVLNPAEVAALHAISSPQ
jgi:hypothetical protein